MDTTFDTTRRSFLQGVGGVLAAGAVAPLAAAAPTSDAGLAPVAVSDRAVGLRQHVGVFAMARDFGATGVELDFGRLGGRPEIDSRLVRPASRHVFDDAATEAGVPIVSLRLGALADTGLTDDPRLDAVMNDFLHTLHAVSIRVGVLPVGRADDLGGAGVRALVIGRLAAFAGRAVPHGTTLALDAPLPPAELAGLLDEIGSPGVKACVGDVESFKAVGPERVAQIRFRYDGVDPVARAVELNALRRATTAAGWRGWVVVDRPAASGGTVLGDAGRAVRQVRSIFT